MADRPLSPISELPTPASRYASVPDTSQPRPSMRREVSYESEHEGEGEGEGDNDRGGDNDDGETASIESGVSSGETITQARVVQVEEELPASPSRMTMARPIDLLPYPTTPSKSGTTTPISKRFDPPPPPPGGLFPPPRPMPASAAAPTRDRPDGSPAPLKEETQDRVRRQSYYDNHPGGRDVINLDTDDEDGHSIMSTSTALTAGLAGIGAGERGKHWNEADLGVLKEESPFPSRRGTAPPTPTPTPPRSRRNSYFTNQDDPTLHNIPTFTDDQTSPTETTLVSATRKLKSPHASRPGSRPTSRPNSIRSPVEVDDGAPHRGLKSPVKVSRRRMLINKQSPLSPPLPLTPLFVDEPERTPSRSPSPLSTRSRPNPKKRRSRIIPAALLSLFSDERPARAERPTSLIELDKRHGTSNGSTRLSKPRRANSGGAKKETLSKKKAAEVEKRLSAIIPADPVLLQPSDPEFTVRHSGTFGIQEDGSDVAPLDRDTERGRNDSMSAADSVRPRPSAEWFALGAPIVAAAEGVSGRSRTESGLTQLTQGTEATLETLGTAKPLRQDRLYVHNASSSISLPAPHPTTTLPPIDQHNHLQPIDEKSSSSDHSQRSPAELGDILHEFPRGMVTRPLTPPASHDDTISAVTPPHPLPPAIGGRTSSVNVMGSDALLAPRVSATAPLASPILIQASEPDNPAPHSKALRSPGDQAVNTALAKPDHASTDLGALWARNKAHEMVDQATQTSLRLSARPLPQLPIQHTTAQLRPSIEFQAGGPGAIPLDLASLASQSTSNPDLALLIASHLLSTHASALMRHSSQAQNVSEEMQRLARESLQWGQLLMSLATTGASGRSEGGTSGTDDMSSEEVGARYEGLPNDRYTRVPPRSVPDVRSRMPRPVSPNALRSQHLSVPEMKQQTTPLPSTETGPPASTATGVLHSDPHSADTPIVPDASLETDQPQELAKDESTRRRAERRWKAESLPPEWLRHAEEIGWEGWTRLREAELVWRRGMDEQRKLWNASASPRLPTQQPTLVQRLRAADDGIPRLGETASEGSPHQRMRLAPPDLALGMTSREYLLLEPLHRDAHSKHDTPGDPSSPLLPRAPGSAASAGHGSILSSRTGGSHSHLLSPIREDARPPPHSRRVSGGAGGRKLVKRPSGRYHLKHQNRDHASEASQPTARAPPVGVPSRSPGDGGEAYLTLSEMVQDRRGEEAVQSGMGGVVKAEEAGALPKAAAMEVKETESRSLEQMQAKRKAAEKAMPMPKRGWWRRKVSSG